MAPVPSTALSNGGALLEEVEGSLLTEEEVSLDNAKSMFGEAEVLKERGNKEFLKGKALVKHTAGKNFLSDACLCYAEGLQKVARGKECLDRLQRCSDDEFDQSLHNQGSTIEIALYLNLAACNLLLSEWDPALACCTQVLGLVVEATPDSTSVEALEETGVPETGKVTPDKVLNDMVIDDQQKFVAAKALYRRSQAYVGKGNVFEARSDLLHAQKLKSGDANICGELQKVNNIIKNAEAAENLKRETLAGKERAKIRMREKSKSQLAKEVGEGNPGPADGIVACASHDSVGIERSANRLEDSKAWELERLGKDRREFSESEDAFSTKNGGICRNGLYKWNQSISEVQLGIKIPKETNARDVDVTFRRLHLSVTFACVAEGGKGSSAKVTVLCGALSRPVRADECLWTMECPGQLHLYLYKELGANVTTGQEWWECVMDGDLAIDVQSCDAEVCEYPEHIRRGGAKALWEHHQKAPEELQAEQDAQ
ncbi:unnamed protein product, partial [Choristocarpus tenellus]